MKWLETSFEKRRDIYKVYSEVKSIIVCAMDYYNEYPAKEQWKISKYAGGKDYHIVVRDRLKVLLDYIQSDNKSITGKIFVDTGPVMEKVWAQRAGIGWIGKNTCLITPEKGSWVFLGVILLNKDLEYDKPAQNKCGDCKKCITSCPAEALTESFVLNANRCISYLTIEHRGEISEDLKPKIENKIFGCDTCQEVCPWNKRLDESKEPDFKIPPEILDNSIEDFIRMDSESFNRVFRESPVKRVKYEGFLRNVKIVKNNGLNQK